jgi:putative flippase GtrA
VTRYLRSFANRKTLGQVVRVGLIGGFNTLVYYIILNIVFGAVGPFWAATVAFILATALSYYLNRRWSFQIDDGSVGSASETVKFFVVNLVALGVTLGVLWLADIVWGPLDRFETNVASVVATALIILPKFAAYRDVVFKGSLSTMDAASAANGGTHTS